MLDTFQHSHYKLHKQFLKVFGGTFRVFDPSGAQVIHASMKAFRLKEDIRLYADENKTRELLTIKARNILDVAAVYDVYDATTQEKVGALKRKGLSSLFVRDEWLIMDQYDQEIGIIREDSAVLGLLRRFIEFANLIPQKFEGEVGGVQVLRFSQNFNPFTVKLDLDFSMDYLNKLDRRLGIAAAVLLAAIEGRQS